MDNKLSVKMNLGYPQQKEVYRGVREQHNPYQESEPYKMDISHNNEQTGKTDLVYPDALNRAESTKRFAKFSQLFNKQYLKYAGVAMVLELARLVATEPVNFNDVIGSASNMYAMEQIYDNEKVDTAKNTNKKYTVMLDAGHGGRDEGALSRDRKRLEYIDNWNFTQALGSMLTEEFGINVVYTREEIDKFLDAKDRAAFTNEINPDLLVSIHRNSGAGGRGVGVIIGDAKARAKDSTRQNRPESEQRIGETMAKTLLDVWDGENTFKDGLLIEGRHTELSSYALFRTKAPTVIAEIGYIDRNDENEKFDRDFDKIVKALASGVIKSLTLIHEKEHNEKESNNFEK